MSNAAAAFSSERRDGTTVLTISGRLDARETGRLWRQVLRAARGGTAVRFDLGNLEFCDMSGAALLAAAASAFGDAAVFSGASDSVTALVARARIAAEQAAPAKAAPRSQGIRPGIVEVVVGNIAYLGEVAVAFFALPARHRMLRWPELFRYAEQAGVRAIPLVILLGFLMGLILAFQSAVPMRRFGADLFVANLVSISLLRELGPLLSAVILAGRTGSAFAAEIGSMKVNQEIDALTTMSLDPVTMLVIPRLIAAMLVMPVLVLALDVAGLLGMTAVMGGFGYPVVAIAHQVQISATPADMIGGLFKGMCFGAAVATIGCRTGLGTGVGPRAVGEATTAAVVGGIVSTILLDGLFSLLFYRLGL